MLINFFNADVAGWPDASCRFPDWLAEVTWRDLAGQSRYSVDDESMTFFVHSAASSKHHHHHHQSDDRSEFRCLQKTSETDQRIVVYAFAMHNWLVTRKRSRFVAGTTSRMLFLSLPRATNVFYYFITKIEKVKYKRSSCVLNVGPI